MVLQSGTHAPAFSGIDQNGKKISLKDFKGQKLVVYFYPKDNTPTCTVQACNLRDNFSALQKAGIHIVGISTDSVASHKKFETKYNLPFPLIADEDKSIAKAYGVWGEKKFMGKVYEGIHRTTFLIDERGIIREVISKPNTKDHAAEIIQGFGL